MLLRSICLICAMVSLTSQESVEDFLHENIPQHRNKRFVNSQEYNTVAEAPKYLVRLARRCPRTHALTPLCSGSIIGPDTVLTSGGCLHKVFNSPEKKKRLIPLWQIRVVAGDWNITIAEANEQVREPIQMYLHPELKTTDHRMMWKNDIAILKLNETFTLNSHVASVDLWLSNFATNTTYTQYYTMLKASGYGDAGSANTLQYSHLFDTHYDIRQTIPQYQYYAFVAGQGGQCIPKFTAVSDIESGLVTFRPHESDPYSPKLLASGKRCFYTGSIRLAGYIPTAGDYGGPITWTSRDDNSEYQVFLTPWQPETKASFTTGQNYKVWGELLSNYKHFIGEAMSAAAGITKDDHLATLTPTSAWQTWTQTADLTYFGNYQYLLSVVPPTGKYPEIEVTVTGSNAANTMRNSELYIRSDTDFSALLHFSGEDSTLAGGVVVTPSTEGSQASKWGCTTKTGITYTDPAGGFTALPYVTSGGGGKRRKRDYTPSDGTIYSCEDQDYSGVGGAEEAPATMSLKSAWEALAYTGNTSAPVYVDLALGRPTTSADTGSITVEVKYRFVDAGAAKPAEKCHSGHLVCEDDLSCIEQSAVCDHELDCMDGLDETAWCLDRECDSGQYKCLTGECINALQVCDGRCDCLDKTTCEDETLLCSNNPYKSINIPDLAIEEGQTVKVQGKSGTRKSGSGVAQISYLAASLVLFLSLI